MISRTVAVTALLAIAACAPSVPDSNPSTRGVGFSGYDDYAVERSRRDAILQSQRVSPVPEERAIAQDTIGVLNATRPIGGTTIASPLPANPQPLGGTSPVETAAIAPVGGTAAGAAPVQPNNPGISDEQNFGAVSSRETIQSDAERIARNRESYEVIQPEALPARPKSTGPDIVAFALSTTNRVGEQVYSRPRSGSDAAYRRACAAYSSADQAQSAFLSAGGPKTDRKGLDPDGDGFACFWDPSPFRAARGG